MREVGLALVSKVSRRDARQWGFAAIIVSGLAYTAPTVWKEFLSHQLASQQAESVLQLRFAELEKATIKFGAGASEAVRQKAEEAVVRDLEWDSRRARMLASGEFDEPLLRFVVAEADGVRPALLNIGAPIGNVDINGLTLPAKTAHAVAKTSPSPAFVAKAGTERGWTTVIHSGGKPIRS